LFDTYEHNRDPQPGQVVDPQAEAEKRLSDSTLQRVDTPTETLLDLVGPLKDEVATKLSTHTGLRNRVDFLRLGLEEPDEPSGPFYNYVDHATPEKVSNEFRDKLARQLFEAWKDFENRIEETLQSIGPDELRKRSNKRHLKDDEDVLLEAQTRFWPDDGMYWADKVVLEWLAEWTNSIDDLESSFEKARQRWIGWRDDGNVQQLLKLWADPEPPIPLRLWPVKKVTEHLWEREIRPQWERHQNKQTAAMTGVRYGDNQDVFARLDKTAGATPTKGRMTRHTDEGPQPVDVDDANDLEIDDERFTNAPGVLRMIPQQWGVAREADNPDPSTTQLPLGIDPEQEGASVAFRIFADSQVQLKPTAAKIVVGLHLLSPQTGGLGSVELGELTRWVNQGKSRPEQKRNRRKVRDNLIAARSLGVPPNLDGTGHNIQMFEIHPPDHLDKDAEVVFGHTRGFEKFLSRIENGEEPFGQLRGKFVLNADGFMRISGNDSDAARMYLALCAMWNDHGWDPDRLPFRRIDELARRANQLSEQARRVLDEGAGDRKQLRQGRHQTKKAVEKLADEYELVGDLEVKGPEGNRELKVRPNERHREAWEYLRNHPDGRIDLDDST